MRRWTPLAAIVVIVIAALMVPGRSGPVAAARNASPAAKKVCKTVTKRVHGKKKKVKVCHTVTPVPTATTAPTNTPTLTPTATPTNTATPTATATTGHEPVNQIRQAPAFPGAPPGGFIAGASGTVTVPPSVALRAHLVARQTGTTTADGITISDMQYTTSASSGGALLSSSNVVVTVANGDGFTSGQRICFADNNGQPVLTSGGPSTLGPTEYQQLCESALSVEPAPTDRYPRAAKLTLQGYSGHYIGSSRDAADLTLKDPLNPVRSAYHAILTCGELAVPVTPGTLVNPGIVYSIRLHTPSGPFDYSGVPAEVDPAHNLIYLPFAQDLAGGFNPTNPFYASTLAPAGTPLVVGTPEPIIRITMSRLRATFHLFPGSSSPRFKAVDLFNFFKSPDGTLEKCPECTTESGSFRDFPIFGITDPNGLPDTFTYDAGQLPDLGDLLGHYRGAPLGVTVKDVEGKNIVESVTPQGAPPEPSIGPIGAQFSQPCYCTRYVVTGYRVEGGTPEWQGEPETYSKDFELTYSWSFSTGNDLLAQECGIMGPDPDYPNDFTRWKWYHPGGPPPPDGFPPVPGDNYCSHDTTYHHGVISVSVKWGSSAHCIVTYPYGSRGNDSVNPEFGPVPALQDCTGLGQ